MKKNDYYDERQLTEQARAYRIGFVLSLVLTLAMYLLTNTIGLEISSKNIFRICFWVPFTTVLFIMVFRDAYDGVHDKNGMIFFPIMSIMGLILIIIPIINIILIGKNIMDDMGQIFIGVCITFVSVVYFIKRKQNDTYKEVDDYGKDR